MNFKKPKDQVIADAEAAAYSILSSGFNSIRYNYMGSSPGNIMDSMQMCISMAISSAIRSVVNDTYTDQEFEEDIGLAPKV